MVLELMDGVLADHAPVGHHHGSPDAEAFPKSGDRRHPCRLVRGATRQDVAIGHTLGIHGEANGGLRLIGHAVTRVATLAQSDSSSR